MCIGSLYLYYGHVTGVVFVPVWDTYGGHKYCSSVMYCINVMNSCSNTCTHMLLVMCLNIALYHAWPTLRECLASGLSTRPSGLLSLRASPVHGSLVIITLICVLMWY